MNNTVNKRRTKVALKTERPRLHKVILINDDFTPREFVVTVLKAEFRMRMPACNGCGGCGGIPHQNNARRSVSGTKCK